MCITNDYIFNGKRIVIFINSLETGGAEKQAVLLAKALNNKYNVWLVVYYGEQVGKKFLELIEANEINVVLLIGNHVKRIFSFFRFLHQKSIYIIFSYLLTTNLISGIIGKITKIDYCIGGIRDSSMPKWKLFIQKFLHNQILDRSIFNNYLGAKKFEKIGFKKEKIIVVPNGIDLNVKPLLRKRRDIVRIVSIGRFVAKKDYLTAIKSISMLKKQRSSFEYIIVGWGALENDIKKWISKYEIANVTKLVIDPANIEEYYITSDIYFQTSLYEGLSNTVMEAMSFSLPLVITNVGDNDRLVKDEENGYICEVENIKQISNRLGILVDSYKKRIDFGSESYKKIKDNYSLEKFGKQYISFIESL